MTNPDGGARGDEVKNLVLRAGRLLKRRFLDGCAFESTPRHHLCSEADVEADDLLVSGLRQLFPQASIFSGFLLCALLRPAPTFIKLTPI